MAILVGQLNIPRKQKDGKITVKINGETQYDIIYSKASPEGGFEVDYDRSFIAPDNESGNSYSSITKDIRDKAQEHHKNRFEAKGKRVETERAKDFAKEVVLEKTKAKVAEHVVDPVSADPAGVTPKEAAKGFARKQEVCNRRDLGVARRI